MSTVIIDIETVGLTREELSSEQINTLTKNCKTEAEVEDELGRTALYPLTGKIVCIGMLNVDSGNDKSFSTVQGDELYILHNFWQAIKLFTRVVTFNGRSFDIPYLMIRSAILNVPISRNDLMGQRFSAHPHCDLLEQLSFYGATRRMSLDMYCRAFGIESPKEEGISGADVGRLYAAGEHQKIADYCARDVKATAELYKIWLKRMGK
jgi:predicted PolB exonuclease-like 3'-5' exonuclease